MTPQFAVSGPTRILIRAPERLSGYWLYRLAPNAMHPVWSWDDKDRERCHPGHPACLYRGRRG